MFCWHVFTHFHTKCQSYRVNCVWKKRSTKLCAAFVLPPWWTSCFWHIHREDEHPSALSSDRWVLPVLLLCDRQLKIFGLWTKHSSTSSHTLYRAEQVDTCQMINMKITIISCRLSEECEVSGVNLWQRDQTMFRICAAKWVNAKPDGSVRARQHSTTTTSKLHWRKIQNNKQPLLSRLHYTAGRAAAKHDVSRSPKWLFRSMICSQQQFRRQNKFSSPSFKTDTIRNHHLRGWNSDLLHQLLTWCLSVH